MSSDELMQRIQKLEELFLHQDHTIKQLNEVVLQLSVQNETLKNHIEQRFDQLEKAIDDLAEPQDPNEKPPHY